MRFQSTLRFPQLGPTALRAPSMSVGKKITEISAGDRAKELQQLLEITSELGMLGDLDEFLQKSVVRAADFLNFQRAAIAISDHGNCTVRWMSSDSSAKPLRLTLPYSMTQRLLANPEPLAMDDLGTFPELDQDTARKLDARQLLSIPMRDSHQEPLGLLLVFDRDDAGSISAEDIRRAKTLAAEVAVVLEATQNLHNAKENRERAENLMSLALELNSSLRLPQFVRSFTQRAADMLGARAAMLALAQRSVLETVIVHDPESVPDKGLLRRLNSVLTEFCSHHTEAITTGTADTFLGSSVASALAWKDLTIARLRSGDGELIGVLCLIDLHEPLRESDRNLLHALAAHASVALENARLFTRMDQANRHWVEIFDSITDFIVVHDEQNRVLRVNRTLADFIGVRPSELIGVSMRAMVAMAADNSAQPCPFCRVGLDGADEYIHPVLERTYLVSTSRIHGAMNEAYQTIHVLKDITDRREAERRYRELFDTIQEGLFFSTPDGRFIEVNDALVRMLNYDSREQLLQVDIPHQLYCDPNQREGFRLAIEQEGMLRNYEEALRRRDGSIIHTLQNAFAVRDSQGRIIQYRGLILDITEQKNYQAELQRQRDFNNKILNATQSMILVADTAGLISYANKRCYEAGGFTQEELLGRKLADLVAPGRRELLEEALHATLTGHQVDNLELPILLGRGSIGQFAINLSPMRDENHNVASIVVVMTDITDAAMLQAKLMHTEKMAAVGQLVSGVAHEVNNPLTAILGFADLLIDHPDVPEFAKSDLRVILEEAQRTKQIVQNLLSFARQMPPQRKPVQINGIIRQTLALRAYDFANHGVKIVEKFNPAVREIVGDSHQLQQVFLNILNNAYDAVREAAQAGQILIETAEGEGVAEIMFRDNGPGILYPERIFDPFFTTKEVGKGTGLGLSICYGIIREHQGEITCRNNTDGPGATFLVRLPLAAEAITHPAEASA
jgi:PAS domain S-box-containing protein